MLWKEKQRFTRKLPDLFSILLLS